MKRNQGDLTQIGVQSSVEIIFRILHARHVIDQESERCGFGGSEIYYDKIFTV